MPFAVNTPSGQVRLEDLPLEVLSKMEVESEVQWVRLLMAPATSALSAMVVYRVACEHIGCEPEQLTPKSIIGDGGIFVQVDDDLPAMYEDGYPSPKAVDESPTSG